MVAEWSGLTVGFREEWAVANGPDEWVDVDPRYVRGKV
jgi:hypothetical protein